MKIEIEVDNLSRFIDGFNNAVLAYQYIISSIILGCEVAQKFEPLTTVDEGILLQRKGDLVKVYEQLIEIEKSIDKN